MIHRRLLVVAGVLAYLGVGVMTVDPPVNPWQAINPALGENTPYDALQTNPDVEPTYAETDSNTDLTPEEEALISELPFKLPFKMDKKQLAVAMKLLKAAIKPVIKSKTLRETVAYLDALFGFYSEDLEAQMYMTLLLDSLQDMYEGKEAAQLHKLMKGFFTDITGDEATARSIDDMWRSTLELMYDPVKDYFFRPVNNYLVEPISSAVSGFAERIGKWMGGNSNTKHYVNVQYPESYSRWSETVSSYANRLSDWTAQARQGLEMAARMLEAQDMARSCSGNCQTQVAADDSTHALK
ncbi:uncharacterized protein LOC121853807 isoform X2 [Homarus americanus]|nr:uncharacterized protein LOC121853807 isoform X2 [Homarus americanus]